MALNPKQKRFVAEYLVDTNATQAAIRAGYTAKNADVTGPRMLGNVGIKAAIDAAQAKINGRLEITAEKVMRDIEELRIKALAADAFAPALRASELQGKTIRGLFSEQIDLNAKIDDENPATPLQLAREIAFALTCAMRAAAEDQLADEAAPSPNGPGSHKPRR